MKKSNLSGLLLLCSSLLVLLLAGACKGKDEPTNKDLAEGESAKVTFDLSLPQGESFTYRSIHDAPEWKVETLTLYTFSGDGSKLLAIDRITSSELHPNGEAKYTYTKEFAKDKVGVYLFAFVANDEIAGATVGSTSLADFRDLQMTKQLPAMGTSKHLLINNNIPMTGMAEQNGSRKIAVTGTTKGVNVLLTRVVARIDVSNHIPNLTITKLSLENTYDKTTVFHSKNYRAMFGMGTVAKVTMREGFAPLPNPFKGIAGVAGNELKKAFYLYEGPQPAEVAKKGEATTIVVEGTLDNGKSVVYKIPFIRNSKDYSPIDVKRNHLYRLVLGDNKPVEPESKVVFTIEDTPWNSVILNHEMQIIKVRCLTAESKYTHFDEATNTLYTSQPYFTSIDNETEFRLEAEIKLEGELGFIIDSEINLKLRDKGWSFWCSEGKAGSKPHTVISSCIIKKREIEVPDSATCYINFIHSYVGKATEIKDSKITIQLDKNYRNPSFK